MSATKTTLECEDALQTCQQGNFLTECDEKLNAQQAGSSGDEKPSTSNKEKSQQSTVTKRSTRFKATPKVSTRQKANTPKKKKTPSSSIKNSRACKSKASTEDSGPPKKKRCHAKTVVARLEKMCIDAEKVSSCLKSAMSKGHILLTGEASDLEQVIIEGEYFDHTYKVCLKDVLYQPDYAGLDYEDGCQEATAVCSCCDEDADEPGRCYVTRICEGNPQLDSGKFHNHCTDCKGFGKCIGDYREAHCGTCNKHWFTGLSGFPCANCKRKRADARFHQRLGGGDLLGALRGLGDSDDSEDDRQDQDCTIM